MNVHTYVHTNLYFPNTLFLAVSFILSALPKLHTNFWALRNRYTMVFWREAKSHPYRPVHFTYWSLFDSRPILDRYMLFKQFKIVFNPKMFIKVYKCYNPIPVKYCPILPIPIYIDHYRYMSRYHY